MSDDGGRVIVIGSGPTGAISALALVRRGIPVTLLESGQHIPNGLVIRASGRNIFRKLPGWGEAQPYIATGNPGADWLDVLVPGGMSNYWTGAVPRFAPEDFYEGERLDERYRWPISYDDLVPYYDQVEQLLVVSGNPRDVPNLPASCITYQKNLPFQWQEVAKYAESIGHGLTVLPLADGAPWMVKQSGTFFNSFAQIVPRLQRFPHFKLLLGAHAIRLEWNSGKKKVDSVIYIDRTTGSEQRLACAAVVVAAGPLASTKILLNSISSDFPSGLGDTNSLLGKYLHDHPIQWCVIKLESAMPRLHPPAYLTRAPYNESEPLLAASGYLSIPSSKTLDKFLAQTPLKGKNFGVILFGTMIPKTSNFVRLDPSVKDRFNQPQLDIHICYDEETLRTLAITREKVVRILEMAGYRSRVNEVVTKNPGASVHYGGTVRMHLSPKYGVLNGWNRLHAVDNVAVVDASCFTTGVEKNPVVTAMALAMRASDRLAVDLKAS